MKDAILAWVERISGKINNWAWDVRWDKRHKYSSQHEWIKGYNEWKKKTKCPHN